jgi:hypothetical protein
MSIDLSPAPKRSPAVPEHLAGLEMLVSGRDHIESRAQEAVDARKVASSEWARKCILNVGLIVGNVEALRS